MKLVLLAVVCLAALSAVHAGEFTETEYQNAFVNWQRNYSRSFTADEFLTRFINFKVTLDFVHKHNKANQSWTAGLNEFSHLSAAEFKKYYLTKLDGALPAQTRYYTGDEERAPRAATVDWRSKGKVTAVKNQGQCGSCWAFASTATIESAWAIKTGKLPVLSDQQVLDCTGQGSSCGGGVPYYAINAVKAKGGHDTMSSYPYKTQMGSCAYNSANSAATVSGVTQIANSEASIASAVNNQPVVVLVNADLLQNYRSGILNDPSCSTSQNHAVTAVGYGNDGAGDYWIIKNSWGAGWGQSGYFQLAKGVNRCGVASGALFPTTTGTGNRI